jgi:hypothetical protein
MYAPILLLGLLSQNFTGTVGPDRNTLDRLMTAADAAKEQSILAAAESREAAYEEHQFIESFNKLVVALSDFSDKYKKQHVIDIKKVHSIKKAYEDLERADAWFKVEKQRLAQAR